MPYKNYLEVERETEKRFYQICHELHINGEAKISNASTTEWANTLRLFGQRSKPLVKKEFIEPVWRTLNRKKCEQRLIRVPKGITIVEQKKGKTSRFNFFKKK